MAAASPAPATAATTELLNTKLQPGDAALLLAKLSGLQGVPAGLEAVLRQHAAEEAAAAVLKVPEAAAAAPAGSGAVTPSRLLGGGGNSNDNDRVAALCQLSTTTLNVVRDESHRRQEAEERARKAEAEAQSQRLAAEQAQRDASAARRTNTWRGVWRLLVMFGGVVAVIYVAGLLLASLREPVPLSMDVRFVNPSDGSRITRPPKSEIELGSFAGAGGGVDSKSSWRLAKLLLWPYEWWTRDRIAEETERNAVVVYPLTDSINSEECILVTPDEIRSGRLLAGRVPLLEVRTSLLYHLASKRITAVCAQHIGVPACYCILDTRTAKNFTVAAGGGSSKSFMDLFRRSDGADYLELFDPSIIGFSRNRILQVQEKNVFCQKPYFTKRFEAITVEFLDAQGVLWERDFRGVHSFNLQHAAEIHRGMRTCLDDSADLLLQMLRGRVGGSPERSAFERQMLFSNTEAHRTERPPLPAPRPPALLPKIGGGGGDDEQTTTNKQ